MNQSISTSKVTLALRLIAVFAMFTLLTGARGCQANGANSSYTGYTSPPPSGGGSVVTGPAGPAVPVDPGPAPVAPVVFTGDLALTVYAPLFSSLSPDTETFNVTIREGGAFGAVIVEGTGFVFDASGVGALDITELPLGFYDVEVLGIDFFGNAVSYAATSVSIEEPLTYLSLELEPVVQQGDVVLEMYEPDNGAFAGPIDSIDYVLWELDPVTGEYTLVEEMLEIAYTPWEPPVIGALELGNYYIEVYAYDAFGYWIYQFGGDFVHDADLTYAQIDLWYAQ